MTKKAKRMFVMVEVEATDLTAKQVAEAFRPNLEGPLRVLQIHVNVAKAEKPKPVEG
jgi:hypothetical protein